LATSTAIADHVSVDFELRGCPIDKHQLIEVIRALMAGRRPRTPSHSVCLDCKRRGSVCVVVTRNLPCLGPVTQSGCGAICPAYDRGCYGCFGPAAQPNLVSLSEQFQRQGTTTPELVRGLRLFNAYAPEFRQESGRLASVKESPT
jgi:coenzyme F420-reducing hydrogenase gamma subunit